MERDGKWREMATLRGWDELTGGGKGRRTKDVAGRTSPVMDRREGGGTKLQLGVVVDEARVGGGEK